MPAVPLAYLSQEISNSVDRKSDLSREKEYGKHRTNGTDGTSRLLFRLTRSSSVKPDHA